MTATPVPRPIEQTRGGTPDGYLLQSEADLAAAVTQAIEKAKASGADQAVASVSESAGLTIRMSEGEVETASREGKQALRIMVYQGGRTGSASTEALDDVAIDRVVAEAIAIARQLEPDQDAGLADPDTLAWSTPSALLFAPSGLTGADLAQAAAEVETGARAARTADTLRVLQAGAASHDMRWALATSAGFCRASSASLQQRWCVALAERDGAKVQDSWMASDRRLNQLPSNASIGAISAERALGRLGATDISTRRAPVLFDATVATELVSELCQALTGGAQFRRMTFIPDALGQSVAADHLRLQEDPFEPFGLASADHDGEGVAGVRRDVIVGGRVEGLFLDTRMARKLGMRSTGSASGFRNLTLSSALTATDDGLEAMLRKLGTGLWLTEFLGGDANPVTGAFSKAAVGFWVEAGEVVGPVQNFTVAGNVLDLWRGIVAVGADVHRSGALRSGSLLVDNLQIAGR